MWIKSSPYQTGFCVWISLSSYESVFTFRRLFTLAALFISGLAFQYEAINEKINSGGTKLLAKSREIFVWRIYLLFYPTKKKIIYDLQPALNSKKLFKGLNKVQYTLNKYPAPQQSKRIKNSNSFHQYYSVVFLFLTIYFKCFPWPSVVCCQ